jgi:hypothetical protein
MGLSMQEKKALAREISKRYQKAQKKEKTVILNELVKTTGYNRKYVLYVLANWGKTAVIRTGGETVRLTASPQKRRKGGGRKPKYTGGFVTVLRKIWVLGVLLVPVAERYLPPSCGSRCVFWNSRFT